MAGQKVLSAEPVVATGGPVSRRGGVQLWRQIADRMREAITHGAFGDSMMMPSEMQLAAQFSVNRHTVRAALAALAREGLVEAVQGRGTMILRRDRLRYPIARRTRFSEGLAGQAERLDFLLLGETTEDPGAAICERLDLAPATLCLRLETLGRADGLPLSRATHHFPAARFSGLGESFARHGSITRALGEHGVADYLRRDTEIIARTARAEEAAELALSPGAILFEVTAVNTTADGTPIQYSVTRFPADRIKLEIHT